MTPASLKYRRRRIACHLLGCIEAEQYPGCYRCDHGIYDAEYVQYGKLEPLFRLYWWARGVIRKLGPKKCQQCGKKYRHGYDEYLCSEECHENWLPF